MNEAIKRHLRNAAISALQEDDDDTARELLTMLLPPPPERPQARLAPVRLQTPALPITPSEVVECELIPGPARGMHFWAHIIRDQLIPFMLENGRETFTSHEASKWLMVHVKLTDGDVAVFSGGSGVVWRDRAGDALRQLKDIGVLRAEPRSKVYRIVRDAHQRLMEVFPAFTA